MNEIKQWYKSKTILASISMFIVPLLSYFGMNVNQEDANNIVQLGSVIFTSIASLVAVYGRVTAKTRLK